MNEDYDVTQIGEDFGRSLHRNLKIERCENGYVVKYKVPSKRQDDWNNVVEKVRVFLTNTDMVEFIETYFKGEPKP